MTNALTSAIAASRLPSTTGPAALGATQPSTSVSPLDSAISRAQGTGAGNAAVNTAFVGGTAAANGTQPRDTAASQAATAQALTTAPPNMAVVNGQSRPQLQAQINNLPNGQGGVLTTTNPGVVITPAATNQQVRTAENTMAGVLGSQTAAEITTAASSQGGGPISDALMSGVQKIVSFAQNGMDAIEKAIQADMNANNGQTDPAKMQQYTMKIQAFQTIMEMAAKIEEKRQRSIEVWLQR